MAASQARLSGETLTSYAALQEYVNAFAEGHLNLLILIGRPGLAKSRALRQAVGQDACWIEGNATAFGMYQRVYEAHGGLVILDDVDGHYADAAAVRLLKSLCQTERIKTLSWTSAAAALAQHDVPRTFTTSSRVAIVGNDWSVLNKNVAALEDRGHLVFFDPPPSEVHRHVAGWFWDQQVYDFIGARVRLFENHSMRLYIHAWELKKAGIDWRRYVLGRLHFCPTLLLVAQLKADRKYRSEEQRVAAFVDAGGGCRATYFNYVKKLPSLTPRRRIRLTTPEPVDPPDTPAVLTSPQLPETGRSRLA
jgi:hypothetical protein